MTTYGEYQDRNRLTARYRRQIRSYGTHGDPKEAMIEADLTVFGCFGDPGLPHHYAGVYFIASGSSIKIGEAADPYERMRDFHTGNPHGLELLHVIAKAASTPASDWSASSTCASTTCACPAISNGSRTTPS